MSRSRIVGAAVALAAVAFGLQAEATAAEPLRIRTLSNRADRIASGDALVEIVAPKGVAATGLRVRLGRREVSSAFAVRGGAMRGRIVGLVRGLAVGRNVLSAQLPGATGARLVITNHPRGGPVFSGKQIQPWPCAEGALDAQCNRKTAYEYSYMPEGGGAFVAYDPENPPSDVAQTTTDQGKTVPYIVRSEVGTMNRSQYRIAVLFDPGKPWTPWQPQAGWNHKLVITHGAGCDTTYGEQPAPDVLNDTALSRGFAVMSHALDHNTLNCNVVTQGESLSMTKEQLVDHYGEIRYTIGTGCSGGAVTQYQVANAYPGLYQGITPACSFPDSWSSRMLYEDYSILRRYLEDPSRWAPGVAWATDDMEAAWGHPNPINARVYNSLIAPVIDPSRSCPGVPAEDVYDAETNPEGVRCSLQDYMVSVLGRRKKDGFAGKPWDNVGVQYGLRGLMAGKITREQFVDLNVKVGSRDIDYEPQEVRAAGDVFAIEAAYRSGAFNQANNLDRTAIIDLRGPDPGAFHDVYRTYAARARLEREHGHARNQVLWRGLVALMGDPTFVSDAILAMDRWLAAVEADKRRVPLARKLVEAKPDDVTDRCTNGAGVDVPAEVCDRAVDAYSTARIEAGMPYTDDVIKCRLKAHRRSDYFPVRFTDAQWDALQKVFPSGVCDYTKPGVGQQDTIPWATFARGPGGRSPGPAPASVPLGAR